ncbi:MAG: hypothetical protein ACYC6M_09905 [Terriglobales bacterium]
MSLAKRIFWGVSTGTLQVGVTMAVAVINLRLVVHFLSPALAGIWLLFLVMGEYVAFCDVGMSPTLSREIGFVLGQGPLDVPERRQAVADLLATCVTGYKLLAGIGGVAAGALGLAFLFRVTVPALHSQVAAAWLIFAAGAALNLLGSAPLATLFGLGDVAVGRILRAVAELTGLALYVVVFHLGGGIVWLAAVWAAQGLMIRGGAWLALRRRYPELAATPGRGSWMIGRRLAGPSLRWAAIGLGALLVLRTDNVVIAAMLDVRQIPAYEAAARMVVAMMTLAMLVVTSSTPFLSQAWAAGALDRLRQLTLLNVRLGVALMLFLATLLGLQGDRVVGLWLGPGHFVGFAVLAALLTMTVLEAHHVTLATSTMATGYIAFVAPALIAGVLNIVISVVLSRYLGLLGVALGTLTAQLLTNNWYVPHVTFKRLGLQWGEYLRAAVVPLLGVTCVWLLQNALLRYLTRSLPLVDGLFLSILASVLFALPLAWVVLLTPVERAWVRAQFRSRVRSRQPG